MAVVLSERSLSNPTQQELLDATTTGTIHRSFFFVCILYIYIYTRKMFNGVGYFSPNIPPLPLPLSLVVGFSFLGGYPV